LVAFRWFAVVTAAFAYLQVVLGGVVRTSGSGEACPDWPACHGQALPPLEAHALVEYSHRAVGTLTGLLLLLTCGVAIAFLRRPTPRIAWLAALALLAVVAEGLLGAVVVFRDLAPWLVVGHLVLAMAVLGLLVALVVQASPAPRLGAGERFRRLAGAAAAAALLAMVSGAAVVALGAEAACRAWPLCVAAPPGAPLNDLHRVVAGLAVVLVLHTAGAAWRRVPGLRPAAAAAAVASVLQVAAGAGAALSGAAVYSALHVALGSAAWMAVAWMWLASLPRELREADVTKAVEPVVAS